jgi:polysaccharide pyruvyl transferase WcaK-like protein
VSPIDLREWAHGRPRILVTDAWLANAGDGAIALATHQRLRRLAPEAAILHAAYQGDLLARFYPGLELVPPLAGLLGVTPLIPEMGGWDPAAGERLAASADVVLSQGGGFAMEHYDPWERLRAWELVVDCGLPLAFSAQSVGSFGRPRERAILRRVYESAVAIGLRESDSVAHVTDLGAPPERVVVTADEAFSLFPPQPATTDARSGIAVVLSGHPWVRADGAVVRPGDSLDALVALVRKLIRMSDGEHVTLLSTQQGLGGLSRGLEDDTEIAGRVVASLPRRHARRVRVVRGYLPPLQCARLIAGHRGLVSMRMHPAIFGLSSGVPSVLLTSAFKATAMFAMLGLDAAIVRDPALAAERLEALSRRPAGERFDLEAARRRAAANDEVVKRLLATRGAARASRAG